MPESAREYFESRTSDNSSVSSDISFDPFAGENEQF